MKQNDKIPESTKDIATSIPLPDNRVQEFVDLLNAPIVSQLTGILPQEITIDDYKEYLFKKHHCS